VIDGCKSIELLRDEFQARAKVITKDSVNDIALLKSSKESPKVAYFRSGKGIRVGEDIVTIGFPLGEILGSGVKATTGNVSALTGLSNDITTMQITAPIQPGSSGGPLIDKSGNVVGMISSKLNEIMVAKAIGSISQNVNFAIKSSTLQVFLDTNEFDYQTRQSTKQLNTADIVDESRRYTVRVRCLN
jgi:S1-C subfamily serine protease